MNYNKSLFEGVPRKDVNMSRFNMSHEYKNTIVPGTLAPVLTMEALPQDYWEIESEYMFRFDPMFFPIMHKMTMRADTYFIPNRILWPDRGVALTEGWSKWIAHNNFEAVDEAPPVMDAQMAYSITTVNYQVLQYMGSRKMVPTR